MASRKTATNGETTGTRISRKALSRVRRIQAAYEEKLGVKVSVSSIIDKAVYALAKAEGVAP